MQLVATLMFVLCFMSPVLQDTAEEKHEYTLVRIDQKDYVRTATACGKYFVLVVINGEKRVFYRYARHDEIGETRVGMSSDPKKSSLVIEPSIPVPRVTIIDTGEDVHVVIKMTKKEHGIAVPCFMP